MNQERDYLPIAFGVLGLLSVGYAIRLTIREASGVMFYIFLAVQGVILLYLLYTLATLLKETWIEYRWSPDRLK